MGELSPDPARPKRSRRRWVIVGLVLAFASAWAWRQRPRIDERFVGKWSVVENENSRGGLLFELKPDGTGLMLVRQSNNSLVTRQFPWRVVGTKFVVFGANTSSIRYWHDVMEFAFSCTKIPVFLSRERTFQIENCDADSIKLAPSDETATGAFTPERMSLWRRPR